MALLIRNGRVITATDDFVADVCCADGVITRIERSVDPASMPGAEVVDATGKYVLPGFVDPHVHVHLPFMGTHAKDDWASASRAALVGGTTTAIEMVCPGRDEDPLAALDAWMERARGRAACDYSFHMGVTRFDDRTPAALREVVRRGIASFKVFLAYKGAFAIDDEALHRTLALARELGVVVTAHCENAELVAQRQAALLAAGRTGPEHHEPSRPVQVEAEGVHHLCTFAELTGAAVYVVHTSCAEALDAALAARRRGVRVWIEVVLPHLLLDRGAAERPDFEGAKFVMSPPLREARHQAVLWDALRARSISTVATDHAPFDFAGQKDMGRGDFTSIPNGIPSIEHRVDLLHTHGVATGRIDLHTWVDCASTQAARIFGLERKGRVAVGADADLVVYDPAAEWTIDAHRHHMNVDHSAFEGWPVTGRAHVVTLRGEVVARDGRFTGRLGHGRMIERAPTH